MKKRTKKNSEKKRLLNLRVTDKKNQLKAMSEQFQQETLKWNGSFEESRKRNITIRQLF